MGMYFTNWALRYLNYTTRIVFKSSKAFTPLMRQRGGWALRLCRYVSALSALSADRWCPP